MRERDLHTAEEATPRQLWLDSARLLAMLLILGFLVVPLIRDLPLGETTRTAIVAWLLVGLALYWLYAGLGYQPLLLLQLVIFSAAAALPSTKLFLVAIDIKRLSILRRVARVLLFAGAISGGLNLVGMAFAIARKAMRRRTV